MEIINENKAGGNRDRDPLYKKRNTYLGMILIGIGTIWLLDNYDIIPVKLFEVVFSWQMLLVVIGGYLVTMKKTVTGFVLAGVGLLFLMTDFFEFNLPVTRLILPLIVIIGGISFIIRQK